MKKQIIVIASVALVAIILFTTWAVLFKDDGIEVTGDPFYTLSDETVSILGQKSLGKVEIVLSGYDRDDEEWEIIYRFSEAIVNTNRKFSLETESGDKSVKVRKDGVAQVIPFEDFFKRHYDGTAYAFDGESLILNAIYSLCGMEQKEIELRALSGYDTDGDVVTGTGAPFIFPSIQRSQIAFLTITNSHGKYSIYNDNGEFYFGSTRAAGYDDEKFSLLTTNCRYAVAYGKMDIPEGQTWDSYGLNSDNPSTATYSIMTQSDKDGNYYLHTVHIGNLSSTGSYYFARYIGGKFEPSKTEGEGDKLIQNLSKDFIYFLPIDTVDASIGLPETDIMQPSIVNPIENNEQLMTIDNIRIDLYGDNISALAKRMSDFNPAKNLAAADTTALTKVISNKKIASEYSAYSGGWRQHLDVFGAFTSSDGKDTYIQAALARASSAGEYSISFGLLRDEANGAYLPVKVKVTKSYDGVNWHEVENGEITINHADKKVVRYELSFTDETVVKYLRFAFDVPQKSNTYVVFDEIRIMIDGDIDAQPSSAIGGTWKLTAPNSFINEGMNYNFLDMTNFNNFVQIMASLEGERVVGCGFGQNGDASTIDNTVLAKFGLDNPDKHFSFEYDGVVTDIYASKKNENGKYYLYSTFKGELNGQTVNATTDVIVEVSAETAPFLEWGLVDYIDHSLFSIYIVDIDKMEYTVDGKVYEFDLTLNSEGDVGEVTYNGQSYEVLSFKYLYQSVLRISMKDEYILGEGETGEEYFRIKIYTETNSPEIVFYRVSASRCYFTVDGQGSYYALFTDVDEARDNLFKYLDGETIRR